MASADGAIDRAIARWRDQSAITRSRDVPPDHPVTRSPDAASRSDARPGAAASGQVARRMFSWRAT
jgi:hypothetical protein